MAPLACKMRISGRVPRHQLLLTMPRWCQWSPGDSSDPSFEATCPSPWASFPTLPSLLPDGSGVSFLTGMAQQAQTFFFPLSFLLLSFAASSLLYKKGRGLAATRCVKNFPTTCPKNLNLNLKFSCFRIIKVALLRLSFSRFWTQEEKMNVIYCHLIFSNYI